MSVDQLVPGMKVKGVTPGRYAREFSGTFVGLVPTSRGQYAEVDLGDGKTIKARPVGLEAVASRRRK